MFSNKLKISCALCLALFFIVTFAYSAEVVDKIVAIVNDEVITQSEVEESTLSFIADYKLRYGQEEARNRLDEAKNDALNRLIEEKLILQEAKRRNIKISDAEVEKRINEVKVRFGSDEVFNKALAESGITVGKLRDKYRDQLMMKELINGIVFHNIQVTPTQVAAYYYGHKNEFAQPETVKFRIILLRYKPEQDKAKVKSFAEELLKRINAGEDFAALAKEYSEGPNAEDGGEMDFVSKGEMAEEIDEILFTLKEGEVSPVIESAAGCNIVKVEKTVKGEDMSLAEATPLIRQRLYGREAELVLRNFIGNLRKEAYIEIKK